MICRSYGCGHKFTVVLDSKNHLSAHVLTDFLQYKRKHYIIDLTLQRKPERKHLKEL